MDQESAKTELESMSGHESVEELGSETGSDQ